MLRTLGYPVPEYVHIPLLMDAQGRRLAKRDHDLSLTALSRRFTPREIVGMLAFSAGLLPEPRPAAPSELIAAFDWAKVPTQDARLPQALFDGL